VSESNNNGDTYAGNGGLGGEVRDRLKGVSRGENRHGHAYTNGDGPKIRKAAQCEEPPHAVKRHPEDPPGAYQGAAEEIVDPEEIRRNANWFGKASQSIDPEWFEMLTRALYRSVHDTRIGAITIPGLRDAGKQLKAVTSTDAAIAEIQSEGNADAAKAARLETVVVPRVERELEDAEAALREADQKVDHARPECARVREEEKEKRTRKEVEQPRPSLGGWSRRSGRNLFSRVRLSFWKAWLTFLAEVGGSAYLLAPNVADVVGTSYWTGLGISIVISIAMLSAALAAGIGLAAIRLPGWVVGGAALAAFGAILVKFVPALDALRHAGESGVETLTAATLAAFLISLITGYALATAEDNSDTTAAEHEEADLFRQAGSPLRDALEVLGEAQAAKEAAEEERSRCDTLRLALWEKVEKLTDDAARAAAAAERRRQEGIEAEVEVETIQATTQAAIEQEEAAAEWAYLIALAAHEKARVEELPDPAAPTAVSPYPHPTGDSGGLSAPQKLALAVAAGSGIASLALGLIPLGVGIPLAALLVFLDRRSKATVHTEGGGITIDRHPRVMAPADSENPLYRYLPDHMVPKYDDGGADAGQHQ
jgi:hypothetical protein